MSVGGNSRAAFSGRTEEIAQLKELVAQKKNVLITGPAGIGKSALLNQIGKDSSIVICDNSSRLNGILDQLDDRLGCTSSHLEMKGRIDRLLGILQESGHVVGFDHVTQSSQRVARFVARVSEKTPVWIVSRSELAHSIGCIWENLFEFAHLTLSPLGKLETRLLVIRAVAKNAIPREALEHIDILYRISEGKPRHLEELLGELSSCRDDVGRFLRRQETALTLRCLLPITSR